MDKPRSLAMAEMELEPQPGTTLKAVTQEGQFLDEFMTVMRKRIELDTRHLAKLKQLQDSYNPSWGNSSIWPLVSPFINFCGDEIIHLENHISEATACLDRIPDSLSPLRHDKDGFNASEMPENLRPPYIEYLRCYELASSESSVRDLKEYQRESSSRMLTYPLPKKERAYRQAVVQQQQTAELASKWYRDVFPEVLEHHQQRAEAVKNRLHGILTSQSLLASRFSSSNSTAIYDITLFSTSSFIASHHERMSQEKSHTLLKESCYRNHAVGGGVVKPFFGTGIINAVALAHDIIRKLESAHLGPLDIEPRVPNGLFPLEQYLCDSDIAGIQQSHALLWRTFLCTFIAAPPLLAFSSDEISLYSKGIPRDKIDALLKTRVPVARRAVISLVKRVVDYNSQNPKGVSYWYLTGRPGAQDLFRDIWRKWDIEGDCPFPPGVERFWYGTHSKVVWKKTGEEYRRQPGKFESLPVNDAPST
ncbi:hypothetical protein M408DRAFT_30670 [Serendipita vermifera MAFF 305830]|uniref:Uncharacterized protein n=1 Tax=Serendipita vermifera MAFF 305830 TaxID=933852 RepID=A0A0C3A617_SERVB|nr:hypothetical protein M408DRAFT_30670 [Serendipita vermifera MAFF 305830]